jgi:arylformamidase
MDYMSLARDEFEAHFNPRASIHDVDARVAAQIARSADVRARYRHTAGLSYGVSPNEVLDIFHASRPGGPVLLFIHGGYWRALHKDGYSFVAPPFVDAGANVVVIHYDLAPAVTLDTIVAETIRSIGWTFRNIAKFGGNPRRLYIAGNSAGGHLAAMALAHDWQGEGLPADIIKGATLVTGVMDLAPVLNISVNDDVRLDAEAARRNSPVLHPPRRPLPLIVAVGGGEPEGWIALSRAYVRACEEAGIDCDYMEIPGLNHIEVADAVGDPESQLARAMLRQMGLG